MPHGVLRVAVMVSPVDIDPYLYRSKIYGCYINFIILDEKFFIVLDEKNFLFKKRNFFVFFCLLVYLSVFVCLSDCLCLFDVCFHLSVTVCLFVLFSLSKLVSTSPPKPLYRLGSGT